MDGLGVLSDLLGVVWAAVLWVDRHTLKWSRPKGSDPHGAEAASREHGRRPGWSRSQRLAALLIIAALVAGAIVLIQAVA